MKILLVEDNPDDAALTMRGLRDGSANGALFHAVDGAQALRFIFGEGEFSERDGTCIPTFILLDLHLPKLDGMDVLRCIKSDQRTRRVPVVMMTSSAEEEDIRRSYELGVNSYVIKPNGAQEYLSKVSELGRYWTAINQQD